MKIQQWLFELLRKQSVTDGRTDGHMDGRTDGRKLFVLHIWTFLQNLMKIQQWLFELLRKQSVCPSGPCMAYNSISIKHYIKSHLELQREITLIELAPSPYFLV